MLTDWRSAGRVLVATCRQHAAAINWQVFCRASDSPLSVHRLVSCTSLTTRPVSSHSRHCRDTHTRTCTHTHTQPFNGTTWVSQKQKKHSHPSWSSDILYQLPPPTTTHSIILVQCTCLTVLFHNLSPGPLWSSSWPDPLLHTPHISSSNRQLFSQHMLIQLQPVLLEYQCHVIYS